MMQRHDDSWLRRFADRGYAAAEPLAAGMEGAVYRLNDERVGKVWARKDHGELSRLQAFYEQLAGAGLTFATPRFLEVWEVDGRCVTVEPLLPGVPLDSRCTEGEPVPQEVVGCMLDVLGEVAGAGDLASAHMLPVLLEPQPMWDGLRSWPAALQALVDRRLERSGEQLRAAVPGFDAAVDRLRELIAALPEDGLGVIHGDLIPANVLVDDALHPRAVLDFGFFTTAGDPAFDLAVTASVFDMYGPRAHETESLIDDATIERFGCPPGRLALYRAAYAITTATVYDPDGQDGHFRWCAEMLRRKDVAAVLGVAGGQGAA